MEGLGLVHTHLTETEKGKERRCGKGKDQEGVGWVRTHLLESEK